MKSCLKSLNYFCLTLLIVSLLTITVAQAAIEGGNAKKGKALTKEKCKYCHVTGAEGSR